MKFASLLFCTVLPLFLFSSSQCKAQDDPLLNEAKAGHRAACLAIRSIVTSITIEMESPGKGVVTSGKYWRSGELVRIQEGADGQATDDYVVKGGEIRQVGRSEWKNGKPTSFKATRRPMSDFLSLCDVWREMMLTLPGPGGGQLSYDQMLDDSQPRLPTKRENLEARPCLKVSRKYVNDSGQETQLTIWHDLECNYLIRRIDATFSGSKINNSVTASEFVEPKPGVFLPTKCRRVQYTGADVSQIRVTTLTNYTVNQPIPGSEFALPAIASGTILDDAINGTTSAIDSDWRPIGKSKAYEGTTLLPPQSPPEGIEKGQSSTDEPTSWVSVFILAATGLLIASLVWLVRSRRKISQR